MKMSWGNVTLTDKEFFTQMAREVIIRELFYNGTCRVPTLGTFTTKHIDEKIQVQKGANGEKVIYPVIARDIPEFIPHDDMINDINMQGVTKKYRKRLKSGNLSKRDYERQARADALEGPGNIAEHRL